MKGWVNPEWHLWGQGKQGSDFCVHSVNPEWSPQWVLVLLKDFMGLELKWESNLTAFPFLSKARLPLAMKPHYPKYPEWAPSAQHSPSLLSWIRLIGLSYILPHLHHCSRYRYPSLCALPAFAVQSFPWAYLNSNSVIKWFHCPHLPFWLLCSSSLQ